MPNTFIKIGTLLKPLGTNGEIKINIGDDFIEDLVEMDHVFILENGSYIPYFIESLRETNHILIKFEDVNGPEDALSFNLKDVFLKESDITSEAFFDKKEKESIVGYTLYDDDKRIGRITDLEMYPQQIMALVDYKGKIVFIPLVDQLIVRIDEKKESIYMNLPEGILDM